MRTKGEPSPVASWLIRNAYVQANTVAGWRYLDLSGVVINRLGPTYSQVTINTAGGTLSEPLVDNVPSSVQFTPHRILLRYEPIESLQLVADTASDTIRSIAADLEVRKFARVGLRVQYFVPCRDLVLATRMLLRNIAKPLLADQDTPDARESTNLELAFPVALDRSDAMVRVRVVRIERAHQVIAGLRRGWQTPAPTILTPTGR